MLHSKISNIEQGVMKEEGRKERMEEKKERKGGSSEDSVEEPHL